MRALSNAALRALYSQETSACFPLLIELSHPDLAQPLRVVNNSVDLVFQGQTYLAYPFRFDPPDETETQITGARITIDNIDRRFIQIIRSVSSAATVRAVAAFWSDEGGTYFEPVAQWEFILSDVSYNSISITGSLVYEDRLDIRVPALEMTSLFFPGVH